MTFKEWLTQKYLEWQSSAGERKSVTEFAQYLNVSQQTASFWINGRGTPSGKNLAKIADILGWDIYDILGMPRPLPLEVDPAIQQMARLVMQFPEEAREQVRAALADTLQQATERKIGGDEAAVLQLLVDNLQKRLERQNTDT
jgi:transcriptional regulator with XRE-family HTH domain